jgi:hypothetical protein
MVNAPDAAEGILKVCTPSGEARGTCNDERKVSAHWRFQ